MSTGELVISCQCWLLLFAVAKSRQTEVVACLGFIAGTITFIASYL